MNFETWFQAQFPTISISSAKAVLEMAAEGATVPFMARYRKERTGNLDEVGIQTSIDAHERYQNILKRQAFIVEEIDRQKKLTDELKTKILSTFQLEELEDIYLPYKQKRKTKAAKAKEAGLQELADWIWDIGHGEKQPEAGQTLELWAFTFRNETHDVKTAEDAIQGATDILIERLSEMQHLRQKVRSQYHEQGFLRTEKGSKAGPHSKFDKYFSFQESVQVLLDPQNSHRYLAMRRGWMEEELKLSMGGSLQDQGADSFEADLLSAFEAEACTAPQSLTADILRKAARLALKAHVIPSIESEIHTALKALADQTAIHVFAENVRKLLMAPLFGAKGVLGVDPGLRTGCKVAVVDSTGKYIASTVLHLQGSGENLARAKAALLEVCKGGLIQAIAVGNGTAGRETETFIRQVLKEAGLDKIPVVMVNEAGASVYSASEAAREEFPDLDVTVRGAISIARRLQDPLAELVKIDPKSIGVGQYQHDVSQPALKRSLDHVVDSCVNQVGVDVNTASYHLLSHVAGIGPSTAKAIVEHRNKKGLFQSREELMDVSRMTKKAFEQGAGFLRIRAGRQILDNTGVHPERYPILERFAAQKGFTLQDLLGTGVKHLQAAAAELKQEIGEFTFQDIVGELAKPGRDPREEFIPFQFREDIHEVKDLKPGMLCPGIVTNITNFGAFVDIGVHQDGLVHISQLSTKFVKDPREVVSPGDRVQVKVLDVNLEKMQIALTMRLQEKPSVERSSQPSAARDSQGATSGHRRPERNPSSGGRPASAKPSAPSSKPQRSTFTNNPFAQLGQMMGSRDRK